MKPSHVALAIIAFVFVGALRLGADGKTLSPLLTCQVKQHQDDSEILALRIENAQLRAALADAQAKVASTDLTNQREELLKQRKVLEENLLPALGGGTNDEVDWTTDPPSLKKH